MIAFEDLARANRPFELELRVAFSRTLATGRYVLGEQVAAFERELAATLGDGEAVGTGSGFDALEIALRALGLRRGEVVVPAACCPVTILSVLRCGLTPVLADAHPDTFQLDPEEAERRITPSTVALLPVHMYGIPCDMDRLEAIARRRNLLLVEDCAQAQGASFSGRPVGTFGHAAAFSFYPTKNLGALGDGGAVFTADPRVAARARVLRNYGYREKGDAQAVGLNSRLDELQAAFLRGKLPRLPEILERKNGIAARYDLELDPALARPRPPAGAGPARHVYPVLHRERDLLRKRLEVSGIGTEIHYPVPPWRQEAFREMADGRPCPVATRLFAETLSLPLSFGHTDEEIGRVIRTANRIVKEIQ